MDAITSEEKEEHYMDHVPSYYERHGQKIDQGVILSGLAHLLMAQPYNPILCILYQTCTFLYFKKPQSFMCREILIEQYYVESKPWILGNFSDIRDVILVDDVNCTTVQCLATLSGGIDKNMDVYNDLETGKIAKQKTMYVLPTEWIKCLAARNNRFVLMPFRFCCREVLKRSDTRMVRCQSFQLLPEYLTDETFFHVGCSPCNPEAPVVQVYACLPQYAGIRNLAKMLEQNDFMNPAEMLYALGKYSELMRFYSNEQGRTNIVCGTYYKKVFGTYISVYKVSQVSFELFNISRPECSTSPVSRTS